MLKQVQNSQPFLLQSLHLLLLCPRMTWVLCNCKIMRRMKRRYSKHIIRENCINSGAFCLVETSQNVHITERISSRYGFFFFFFFFFFDNGVSGRALPQLYSGPPCKYIVSIWMQLKFFAFHRSSNNFYGIEDLETLAKRKMHWNQYILNIISCTLG